MSFRQIRKRLLKGEGNFIVLLLIAAFIFVLTAWFIEILLSDLAVSFSSIKIIHKHPSVWVVDLIPLLFILTVFLTDRHLSRIREKPLAEIAGLNEKIAKYTSHVNQMGQEDYSDPVVPEDKNDHLGQALYFLQGFLRATNRKENNLKWISEGREIISRILRQNNTLEDMSPEVLKTLTNYLNFVQGAFYLYDEKENILHCSAAYAFNRRKFINQTFKIGEGLVGQCAYEMDFVYRTEIPDDYITISSGLLGEKKPESILLVPLISEEKVQGIMEFASLNKKIPKLSIQFLLEMGEVIGRTIFNLKTNMRTEALLKESRKMTGILRQNEKVLQENSGSIAAARNKLQESNKQLEEKILEVQHVQERMQWLLQNASEITSIYDHEMNLNYISPSVEKILGYTPEEMIQGKHMERLSREGEAGLMKMIRDVIEDPDQTPLIQYIFITREGERLSLESSAKNRMNDAAIMGVVINTRDITERIRAEKEERLKTKMQSLSENSMDMIMRLSLTGHFFYVNPVVQDYIGFMANDILNKSLSEVKFNKALHSYMEKTIHEQKMKPSKCSEEISIPVRIGERLTEKILKIDAIPEFSNQELETILFVGHDITESKRIEKEIQIKNKNIQDSINYAEKIQTALLPEIDNIRTYIPRSFVYYQPRDVVSGDFPWFFPAGDCTFLAAVDCTGHGVPGALLSFIAFFLMKEVIDRNQNEDPGKICDILHEKFRETLKQNSRNADARDGFDIALCKIENDHKMLQFAGAHRPIYHLSAGELNEYKGDRKSIGGIPLFNKSEIDFTNYSIELRKGDKIFLFSDGITDQLGGPYGRKYTPQRLKEVILSNPGYTMQQFNDMFKAEFENWKTGFKQLDDVLVIGAEF